MYIFLALCLLVPLMILSILVDTFLTRISMSKLQHPVIHNISLPHYHRMQLFVGRTYSPAVLITDEIFPDKSFSSSVVISDLCPRSQLLLVLDKS